MHTNGKEVQGWQDVASLRVDGELSVSDPGLFFDFPLVVRVAPGEYLVQAYWRPQTAGADATMVRVIAAGCSDYEYGPRTELLIDFARVAVCDRAAFVDYLERLGNERSEEFYEQTYCLDRVFEVRSDRGDVMVLISTEGDGPFSARELRADGVAVGLEIHFAGL